MPAEGQQPPPLNVGGAVFPGGKFVQPVVKCVAGVRDANYFGLQGKYADLTGLRAIGFRASVHIETHMTNTADKAWEGTLRGVLAQTAGPTEYTIPQKKCSWKAGTSPPWKPHPATSCRLWGCKATMDKTSSNIEESEGWNDATARIIQNMVRENEGRNIIQREGESSTQETEAPSSRFAVPGSPLSLPAEINGTRTGPKYLRLRRDDRIAGNPRRYLVSSMSQTQHQ